MHTAGPALLIAIETGSTAVATVGAAATSGAGLATIGAGAAALGTAAVCDVADVGIDDLIAANREALTTAIPWVIAAVVAKYMTRRQCYDKADTDADEWLKLCEKLKGRNKLECKRAKRTNRSRRRFCEQHTRAD